MSDLLAHLVARTFASTPAVRARLEPLFSTAPAFDEPVEQTGARPLYPPANETGAKEISSVSPTPPVPSAAKISQPSLHQSEMAAHREKKEKPSPPPADISQPSTHPGEIVPQNEKPSPLPETKERRDISPQAPAPSQRPAPPQQPAPRQQPGKREAVVATPSPPGVKRPGQFIPAIKPASVRFEKEKPSPAAPIVRVTIGRIEVRAAPAPASPPRKPRLAPPALTLEAYLNSRKEGAR